MTHTHYKVKHKTGKEKTVSIEEWIALSTRSNNWTIIERLTSHAKAEMPVAKVTPKEKE